MSHKLRLLVSDKSDCDNLLIISDISTYDAHLWIKQPLLQVKTPKECEFIVLPFFEKQREQFYTSIDLQINTCETTLPDGLYEINYSVSPHSSCNITERHFRICQLRNSIVAKMSTSFGCDNDEPINKYLLQAYFIMLSIQSFANQDNSKRAYEFYNKASSIIDRLG